jgi:hypothetical protein
MARTIHPRRTLKAIFQLGAAIGNENVLLNDFELGAVLAGSDDHPVRPGTIANQRMRGVLNVPVIRTTRTPKTRLSEALAWVERKTDRAAA